MKRDVLGKGSNYNFKWTHKILIKPGTKSRSAAANGKLRQLHKDLYTCPNKKFDVPLLSLFCMARKLDWTWALSTCWQFNSSIGHIMPASITCAESFRYLPRACVLPDFFLCRKSWRNTPKTGKRE